MVSTEDVRRIALSLPDTLERASYGGRPSWRTKARMFTWIREDPEALVVWVESVEERDAMLTAEPDTFFTTPHYDDQPILLVRLDAIDEAEATELITDSWSAPRRPRRRPGATRRTEPPACGPGYRA